MYNSKFKIGEKVYYIYQETVYQSSIQSVKIEAIDNDVAITYRLYPPGADCFLVLQEENVHSKISDLFELLQKNIINE
ncbi:MAG: hypothetical protein M9904_02220 [Chitinophagaceae bacterium]|nr:hypothetical protein [Chitinophagaceae bacterium]